MLLGQPHLFYVEPGGIIFMKQGDTEKENIAELRLDACHSYGGAVASSLEGTYL